MRRSLLLVLACVLAVSSGSSQTTMQRDWLRGYFGKARETWKQNRAEAERLAAAMGLPVRKELPDGGVAELQRFEHGRPLYYRTHNLNAARTISTNQIWPGGTGGYSLSGATEILGEWDEGRVLTTHQEFGGRVTIADGASAVSWHSTHVAGTMVAAGVIAAARGMSSQASLRSYDWNNDDGEMALAAADWLRVSNHSYGYIVGWYYNAFNDNRWVWLGDPAISNTIDWMFGFYETTAQTWDDVAFNAPDYLIVKSAGNDRNYGPPAQPVQHWVYNGSTWVLSSDVRELNGGPSGYDCINGSGVSKNVLTVGAVDDITAGYAQPGDVVMSSFSSWGPTDDGRIKPDIVANGISLYSTHSSADNAYATASGTSMASPNVSGSIGLLLEHQKNLNGTTPLRASTLKALIIHTADEAGTASGPDYQFGWGLMNTLRAANVMRDDHDEGGNSRIHEVVLNQGQTIGFQVFSEGVQPLQATLCWTDPAGTPPGLALNPPTRMLVNDLDLRIIGNATTYNPWILDPANPANPATTGDNIRDNVEKVRIGSPAAGWYTVRITHKGTLSGGLQAASLVVTGQSIPQWQSQTSGSTSNLTRVSFTDANIGTVVGSSGTILRTTNAGATWTSQTSGTAQHLYGVSVTSASTGTAVGMGGTIRRTTNGGSTWSAQTSGTANTLFDVFFTSATIGTIVGDGGVILRTTDGGSNWTSQTSGVTNGLLAVCFTDVNTGTVVGSSGRILRTTNGGSSWVIQTSGTTSTLNDVFFTDANTGTVVGNDGVIRRTTNGGASWTSQTSGTAITLNGVSFTSATRGTAVGYSGKILRTTDGGSTWTSQTSGTTYGLNAVCFTGANAGTAVGSNGTILRIIPAGPSAPVIVNARAFLQGPYSSGSMTTALGGAIPLGQPYNLAPWSYAGAESVPSIPSGVVDWVLVELRTGTAAATRVSTRAAFIRSNGSVVDLDGTSPVSFAAVADGNYYIVLRHRNHLAVMSAAAVALSSASPQYDFTDGLEQYYGGEAALLTTGVYGLWAGDADASEDVAAGDRNATWNNRNLTGYLMSDVDLTGDVAAPDRNITWNNRNRASHVPR